MHMRFQHLSEKALEAKCVEEQEKFEAKQPNDPQYCFELLMRVVDLPRQIGLNIVLRTLNGRVERMVTNHPMLEAIGEEPVSIAPDILIAFYFNKMLQPGFKEHSQTFPGVMTLLKQYCHTYIVGEHRRGAKYITVEDEVWAQIPDKGVDLEIDVEADLFARTFMRCIETLYPDKLNIRILAYLSFVLGWPPREIEAHYPDTWKSIKQLVARIRKRLREPSFLDCMGIDTPRVSH